MEKFDLQAKPSFTPFKVCKYYKYFLLTYDNHAVIGGFSFRT